MNNPLSWVEQNLQTYSKSHLCWSSDRGYINFGGKNIVFHQIEKELLGILSILIQNGGKIGVVYPVENMDVCIPLVLEAAYDLSEKQRDKVLLISSNISTRDTYSEVKVAGTRINEFFPLGILKLDGRIIPQIKTFYIKRLSGEECLFLHTSNLGILPEAEIANRIGCVITDTRGKSSNEIERLINWINTENIPTAIFIDTSPDSDSIKLLSKADVPIWGWSESSLIEESKNDLLLMKTNPDLFQTPLTNSIFNINNIYEGVDVKAIIVKDQEIDSALDESFKIYLELRNMIQSSNKEALFEALYSYTQIKYSFERMMAPLDEIEAQSTNSILSKTIFDKINSLKAWKNILMLEEPTIEAHWSKTIAVSEMLYSRFKELGNPKYEKLKEILKDALEKNKKVVIYNFNESYERAIIEALKKDFQLKEDDINGKGIFFRTISDGESEDNFDLCIVFGKVPFRANWLLRTTLAKELIFLLYSSEKILFNRQMNMSIAGREERFSAETREDSLKKLLKVDNLLILSPRIEKKTRREIKTELDEKEVELNKSLTPLMDSIINEEDTINDMEPLLNEEPDRITISNGKVSTSAVKIYFESGAYIFSKLKHRFPLLKPDGTLSYAKISKIKKGDVIVIVANSLRKSLANEIIRKADRHKKMQELNFFVKYWKSALKKGMKDNGDNIASFLVKLQSVQEKEGCPKINEPLTIYFWKEGLTIGPRNSKNIRIIGDIYGDDFLKKNYQQIGKSISRLRGIHQKLLRKFRQIAISGRSSRRNSILQENELVDQEFDLYLEDFADIIKIEKVKSWEEVPSVERRMLDKLIK